MGCVLQKTWCVQSSFLEMSTRERRGCYYYYYYYTVIVTPWRLALGGESTVG